VKFPGREGKSGLSPDARVSAAPRNGEENGRQNGPPRTEKFSGEGPPFFMKKFLTEKYFPLPIRRHIGRQGSFLFYEKFSAKAILGLLQVFNFPIVL
jgi:hypothetical protein